MSTGFLGMRFYDLPNFLICVIFVLIGCRAFRLKPIVQLVLLFHCLVPYLLNELLFPTSYLGDQFRYWEQFNAIRAGKMPLLSTWVNAGNVEQAAVLFSLIPLPLAISPISLGFFNTLLWVALFFWLYRKRVFTPVSLWFYLLYPSMALYTGLSLRETFIFVFMVTAIQFAREGRWVGLLLVLIPLYVIKSQNFFILAPFLAFYLIFGIRHTGVSIWQGVVAIVLGIISLIMIAPIALPLVNVYRLYMHYEDSRERGGVEEIESAGQFVSEGFSSGIYFLLKPFPWEASGFLQLIQAGENLVIFCLFVVLVRAAWQRAPKKLIFWVLFMVFALSVYGLVVFNYGTAARYRYPFVVIFVLFVCADCHVSSLFKPILPEHFLRRYRREAG